MNETTEYLTIKQAAKVLGKTEMWVRRMVHEGTLPHQRELVPGTESVYRIIIPASAIEARTSVSHTRRDDGRSKYTVYATAEELATIAEALKAAGVSVPMARSNPPGTYKARKAAKQAKQENPDLLREASAAIRKVARAAKK